MSDYVEKKNAVVRQLRQAVAQAENGSFCLAAELAELGSDMARKADTDGVYCVECGAQTELDCICDELNHDDDYPVSEGNRV